MHQPKDIIVERWTPASRFAIASFILAIAVLAIMPQFLGVGAINRLVALFIYVMIAAMWNALAGFGGLVSVGQQVFFGLGAYFAIRLSDAGINVFAALFLAAVLVGILALPLSFLMLRLKDGEFAIGMWVVASLVHLLVNLDPLIQGETGTSLIALNAYALESRRLLIYWLSLAAMVGLLGLLFGVLRSRTGVAIQAIRDSEDAAGALGVEVLATKRLIFVFTALGVGMAGALWLATSVTFQPKTYFSVQWTAYMIFMVLVGGIGTFEGAIVGALVFFIIETWFGGFGVWYLIGLGGTSIVFSLLFPRGIWGFVEDRWQLRLLPVGYRLRVLVGRLSSSEVAASDGAASGGASSAKGA